MQVNKIQTNNYNNNPNFGMSLNINKIRTNKHLAKDFIENFEQIAPNLERVSNDIEVTFSPNNFDFGRFGKPNLIKMTVEDKNISLQDKLKSLLGWRHPYKQTSYHFFSNINEKYLWRAIAEAKQTVLGLKSNNRSI